MNESIIMTRLVDWSTLHYGFNIPVEMQPALYEALGKKLERGDKMAISINIQGQLFEASLQNSNFDKEKFDKHPTDIVRVMYTKEKQRLIHALQGLFPELYRHMLILKETLEPRQHLEIEEERQRYFVFSLNKVNQQLQFKIEAVEHLDNIGQLITEEVFEADTPLILKDPNARLEQVRRIEKVRRIDRSIIDHLKKLYDYRCQVTGQKVGERYGSHLVEAHHIDYFVESQNNDSSNLIILSPNFHRVIHQHRPKFNRNKLQFEFENGVIEVIKEDKHLNPKRVCAVNKGIDSFLDLS